MLGPKDNPGGPFDPHEPEFNQVDLNRIAEIIQSLSLRGDWIPLAVAIFSTITTSTATQILHPQWREHLIHVLMRQTLRDEGTMCAKLMQAIVISQVACARLIAESREEAGIELPEGMEDDVQEMLTPEDLLRGLAEGVPPGAMDELLPGIAKHWEFDGKGNIRLKKRDEADAPVNGDVADELERHFNLPDAEEPDNAA